MVGKLSYTEPSAKFAALLALLSFRSCSPVGKHWQLYSVYFLHSKYLLFRHVNLTLAASTSLVYIFHLPCPSKLLYLLFIRGEGVKKVVLRSTGAKMLFNCHLRSLSLTGFLQITTAACFFFKKQKIIDRCSELPFVTELYTLIHIY